MTDRIRLSWARFWMRWAHASPMFSKVARSLAGFAMPPFYGRYPLANMHPLGYVSPSATLYHRDLILGSHVFIDDRVLIYQDVGGGQIQIGARVYVYRDTILQSGHGGQISLGERTTIQPRCQFSAYMAPIVIGKGAQIAANCSFFPYNHGMALDKPMSEQALETRGGIIVEDDVWLGVNVVILDGVRVGEGAVIGAGSVVTRDIPARAIAFGAPARVVRMRGEL
jgi:acetyltransferase-like isoleucine patch superfamily enzyme